MLELEWIGGFNPFNFIDCPVCGGKEFTSHSMSSIWCSTCNARFLVKHTAGDPGCVVHAYTDEVVGTRYKCSYCGLVEVAFEGTPTCKMCLKEMEEVKGSTGHLDSEVRFYQILKTGDYASGWIKVVGDNLPEFPEPDGGRHQKAWEEFQEKNDFKKNRIEEVK